MLRLRAVARLGLVAFASLGASARASTRAPADTGATSATSLVIGMVYDSVAHAPLAGALVQMRMDSGAPRVFSATTDSAGVYRISDVPRGRYLASFFHPVLESLGILPITWRVDVKDAVTHAMFAVPSPATIWASSCHSAATDDSTGLVLGHVHDADSGAPLGGSVVSATWSEIVIDQHGLHNVRRQLTATATEDGAYALCGVPADANVLMRAEHGMTSSGVVEIAALFHGIVVRNFGIGNTDVTAIAAANSDASTTKGGDATLVRRGTARLEGTVRANDGAPLRDVDVGIIGSDARGTTDDVGRFALADLAPGTFTLEARHVGFEPARVIVDLASRRTATVSVTLGKQVPVLSTVHIHGRRLETRLNTTGFLERKQRGFGHFLTQRDIEQLHPFSLTDALKRVPGVQVMSTGGFGHSVVMRGGNGFENRGDHNDHWRKCQPAIYENGMRVYADTTGNIDWLVDVQDVTALEVYTGPGQAPPRFQGEGCGVLVIWTRPNP